MKKLILIFAILASNSFAVDCRDYMRLSLSFWNFDEYHIDSIYAANYIASDIYYSESKLHYTNNNLDSIVRCVDDCEYMHIETITEKTDTSTNKTIYINGLLSEEQLTSIDGDSSTSFFYDMIEEDLSAEEIASLVEDSVTSSYIRVIQDRVFFIDDLAIKFLKNDTLYKLGAKKNTVVVPDASHENVCTFTEYERSESDTALQSITKQKVISIYQTLITNTENGFVVSFSDSKEKWFYTLASEPTTSIHRKLRPVIILEKSKQFDLLGRPAKNAHIIKVSR